jgi:hypothetical protein
MITVQNYFDYAPRYKGKFNEGMKAGHEVLQELKDAGLSLNDKSVVTGDIADVVEMQIKQLNKLVESENAKEGGKPVKVTRPKAEKPNQKTVAHKKAIKAKGIKPSKKVAAKKPVKKAKVKKVVATKKPSKVNEEKLAKKVLKAEKAKIPVKVNKLSLELQIIKGFAALHGKRITQKGLQNKIKSIKKALDSGLASSHKSMLEEIIQKLGKANDYATSQNSDKIDLKLDKDFKEKCLQIVKSAKPKLQVNYLAGTSKARKSQGKAPRVSKRAKLIREYRKAHVMYIKGK